MGQRPERCAVGQTWLSLLALRVTACPFKLLSVRRRRPCRRRLASIAALAACDGGNAGVGAAGGTAGERRTGSEGTDIVLWC